MNRLYWLWVAIAFAASTAASSMVAQQPAALDGVWQTVGYGLAITIRGDSLRAFEVTSISCIPSFAAHRSGRDSSRTQFRKDGAPVTFEVLSGSSTDERRFHEDGAASDMILRRVADMPERCSHPVATAPLTIFDIFWETYREQYAFFDLRKVDWNAMRARYRPTVANASPAELFAVLRTMIEPLHDAHTYIGAPDPTLRFHGQRPDPDPIGAAGRLIALKIIADRYLATPLHSFANGHVSFGLLKDSIAYLRVNSFSDYVPDSGFGAYRRALDAALDTVFVSTTEWRGLVIDVRINGGGEDPLGLAIAERLTATPYTAYAKVARSDPDDPRKMTPPQPSVVRPSARPSWYGPVVELTSRYSVSAAETFTQALMGRRPAISRIGENTQGVFSDILGRHLPNAWQFGLPNELFLTEEGTSFDGEGIPPTIAVPPFTAADLTGLRDTGLDRAIAVLRGQ